MSDRCFTPRTARQTLDALRPVAETLCRLYRKLERIRPARILPDQPVDPVYFKLISRLHATLSEIQRRGAQVKDLRQGQLDFPALAAPPRNVLCISALQDSLTLDRKGSIFRPIHMDKKRV